MTQPDNTSWLQDGWRFAILGWGTLMTFLGSLGAWALLRLISLEKTAVTREEFINTLEIKHEENKEDGRERKAALDRIEAKIDAAQFGVIAQRLDRIESDIQKMESYAGRLKHEHIDPYEREVSKLRIEVDALKVQVGQS